MIPLEPQNQAYPQIFLVWNNKIEVSQHKQYVDWKKIGNKKLRQQQNEAFENEDNVEEQSFSNGIIQFQDFRGIGLFTPIHLQQRFTWKILF